MSIIVFVMGLFFGSFLNVCIYRLPKGESIVFPGSKCPKCSRPIRWYDNIPVLSFLILRARCRACKGGISFRYPLIEILTAVSVLLLFLEFGVSFEFFSFVLLSFALIVCTFIDFDHLVIPDIISIPGIFIGILLSPGLSYKESTIGALVGGGSLILIGVLGKILFRKEAMGGGDIKLLAMIGAFLGWKLTLLDIFISSLFGVAGSIPLIALKKKGRFDYIPYGPYLSLGAFVLIIWGDKILNLIYPTF